MHKRSHKALLKGILLGLLCLTQLSAAKTPEKSAEKASTDESDKAWNPEVTKGPDGRPVRWLNDLGLDETQRLNIRKIWKSNRGDVEQRHEELAKLREELRMMVAGNGSVDEAMDLHRRIQTLQAELSTIDMVSMLAIRDLLTPKQREKFVKHMTLRGRLGEIPTPQRIPEK